MSKLLINV